MEKLVSVIMPTYNGSKTIERAINSVLSQTYQNIELIVVNDKSTDNVKSIVNGIKDKRIKFVDVDKKINGSHARNFGFSHSTGEIIGLLDDDDYWSNLKVQKMVTFLSENPEYNAVISDYIHDNNGDIKLVKTKSEDYTKDILQMNAKLAAGSNIFISRESFSKLNGFDESFEGHQDLEFLLRYCQSNKLGHVPGGLVTIFGHSRRASKNADNLYKVKEIFLKKFKKLIENFDEKTKNQIFARHWLQVSRAYAFEGKLSKSKEFLDKSLSYSLLKSKYIPFLPFEGYYIIIFKNAINKILRKN